MSNNLECCCVVQIGKKVGRRLIRISTAEGKWQGNWNADYSFSLRDLRLQDLVEVGDPNDARVFVSLSIHRVSLLSLVSTMHITWHLYCVWHSLKTICLISMQGLDFQLMGQLTRHLPESVATALLLIAERYFCVSWWKRHIKCASVIIVLKWCKIYCQITSSFNVWVLSSNKDGDSNQLPEIGGDDPSVSPSLSLSIYIIYK